MDAELHLALLIEFVLSHALIELISIPDRLPVLSGVRHLEFFAKERAVSFNDCFEHGRVIQLPAIRQAVDLQFTQLLLASNELKHAVHEVVPREVIKTGLGVPRLHAHIEASLLIIVALEQIADHVEPARAPFHLVDPELGLQVRHVFLESAEVGPVELNELAQLVRL